VNVPAEFSTSKSEAHGGLIPEDCMADDSETGCKKKKNISLFYETTAGILALIRPCGIVVSMTEMFTNESYTQVFLFILRTFCREISDLKRLKYLRYDLVAFLKNQAKNSSAGATVLIENVNFLVDFFMCRNIQKTCACHQTTQS
jgi:hypothetical protein